MSFTFPGTYLVMKLPTGSLGDFRYKFPDRAYFVDARNIGDVDVLLEIVEEAGLSVDAARNVLDSRKFKGAVDDDWAKSRETGVTGVPTFIAGGFGVVGAQPYEALEKLIKEAGAAPRP